MKLKITTAIVLLLTSCFTSHSQTKKDSIPYSELEQRINEKIKQAGIIGMGAAIIDNKKTTWMKGFGYSDKENQLPFTSSTVMNIASISKTFTGFCIMKAVEEGKLSLDEDINTYLPFKIINPNFPEEKITLRHLATHTSSLTDRYPFYSDSTMCVVTKTPEKLGVFLKSYFVQGGKHYLLENFLNHKPGTFREYSNFGAGLAGYIVELQTGLSLEDYARKMIFKPLGMKSTTWSYQKSKLKNYTKLYHKDRNGIQSIPLYHFITYPDGGIRTSVEDLSKFYVCLLNDGIYNGKTILKKELAQELMRFQFTESNKPTNVNLKKLNSGIFWATKNNASKIGHNGSDPGVRTFMLSDLEKKRGIILFFNTSLEEEKDELNYYEIFDLLDLTKF